MKKAQLNSILKSKGFSEVKQGKDGKGTGYLVTKKQVGYGELNTNKPVLMALNPFHSMPEFYVMFFELVNNINN